MEVDKEFSKWWKEYQLDFETSSMSQEICAIDAFKVAFELGHEEGFKAGQENMLEAGYQLPYQEEE